MTILDEIEMFYFHIRHCNRKYGHCESVSKNIFRDLLMLDVFASSKQGVIIPVAEDLPI
ncbi:MAG: hypothetical protein OXE78_00795 [Gammaproteobacteria bacterium]|nr:hypothetical protein [Gammaproteobacteria bacterium]MCY4357162.1 hypothetical protein [Gammaproteobacteria bacterium]